MEIKHCVRCFVSVSHEIFVILTEFIIHAASASSFKEWYVHFFFVVSFILVRLVG